MRQLLLARYWLSYRVVMLFYRVGRLVRGRRSASDGAALATAVE